MKSDAQDETHHPLLMHKGSLSLPVSKTRAKDPVSPVPYHTNAPDATTCAHEHVLALESENV